jgi:hypothetical protein
MKEKGVPLTPKVVRFLTGRRNSFKKKASLNFRGIRIGIRPCPSGRDWVAPLFRGTAVVTEHGKDARRLPRRLSLALLGGSRSTTGEQSQAQPLQSGDARA